MANAASQRTINLDPAAGGVGFPRLLFALLRQRFTGTVQVSQADPAGARTIWVRGGMPVFTDWSSADTLGDMLLHGGAIDARGFERGLTALRSGNGLLGEILVGLELIDERTRTAYLRQQATLKITRMFETGALGPEALVTAVEHGKGQDDELAQINVLALIFAGVREHYDEARIRSELGAGLDGDLVATPAVARYERQFGFADTDAQVLSGLGRGVTLGGLLVPGVDRPRALHVLYTLWACQMLRAGDDATQAIAKGATAGGAGHQLGASLVDSSGDSSGAKPKPRPKPASSPKPAATASAEPRARARSKPAEADTKGAATKATAKAQAAPPDGAFETRLVELEAKIADKANAFALFGLSADASRKDVRDIWAELSKTYHPDGLEGAGRSQLRPRVEAVFAALSEAYSLLSNKEEREQLRASVEAAGDVKSDEDTATVVRNAFEAEIMARDADKLLKARSYDRAREIYERAHALSPNDSDIEAALHYSRFRAGNQGLSATDTLERLGEVITVTPNCARAHYFKGLIHLGLDDLGLAKTCFADSLRLDGRNIDAQRQLRAIKIRERGTAEPKAKSEDKKGFGFRDLFGKK